MAGGGGGDEHGQYNTQYLGASPVLLLDSNAPGNRQAGAVAAVQPGCGATHWQGSRLKAGAGNPPALRAPASVLQHWLGAAQLGELIAVSLPLGWWACTVTARDLRVADPSSIVWDEVVAFWLVLWLIAPAGWLAQLVAFALFRFFDAAKPGPVGWADSYFKGAGWRGGFGILVDDLVAAFCTLLVIAVWRTWT